MTADRVLPFVLALLFIGIAVQAIRTGRTKFGRPGKLLGPWILHRERRPIAFWLAVSFYLLMAGVLVFVAMKRIP